MGRDPLRWPAWRSAQDTELSKVHPHGAVLLLNVTGALNIGMPLWAGNLGKVWGSRSLVDVVSTAGDEEKRLQWSVSPASEGGQCVQIWYRLTARGVWARVWRQGPQLSNGFHCLFYHTFLIFQWTNISILKFMYICLHLCFIESLQLMKFNA